MYFFQNPKNCHRARKLVCDMSYTAGFGSLVHHAVACMIAAYANNRTLILQSRDWYGTDTEWETLFQPISNSCTSTFDQPTSKLEGK